MPRFSIITPVYCGKNERGQKRREDLRRAISSVNAQTVDDYEHIIIDDGSPDSVEPDTQHGKYIRFDEQRHLERVYAYKKAFKMAEGEWFCMLDSDDVYMPHYLEAVEKMIEENPDHKMFNFGAIYIHTDYGSHLRGPFKPEKRKVGHEVFGGGVIPNGTFVWHRSLYEELGDFPEVEELWNPWGFSIAFQEEFPETEKYFMVDHENEPNKIARELGNPWGQDYALFYRYTRKYHCKPFNQYLYIIFNK